MQNKLITMLKLQDEMNSKVNPEWRSANYAWYRAVWTECAEMLDHYGWKWWKHQEPDLEQVKLEMVDIWHFALSIQLMQRLSLEQMAAQLQTELQAPCGSVDIRQAIEQLAESTIRTQRVDIALFAQLMQLSEIGFDELFSSYVGKNVLNIFRQDHGYKTGSYQKLWHGREDNEHLVEVIETLDANSADYSEQLYRRLEAIYPD